MKLVFVYNADSGLFNTVSDMAHKVLSPKTYPCNLCTLTHGYFSERKDWLDFLRTLKAEMEFLHRDEFLKRYPKAEHALPAIFIDDNGEPVLWVGADEINALPSVAALQELINEKMTDLRHK